MNYELITTNHESVIHYMEVSALSWGVHQII
jgi:hypothetical protein